MTVLRHSYKDVTSGTFIVFDIAKFDIVFDTCVAHDNLKSNSLTVIATFSVLEIKLVSQIKFDSIATKFQWLSVKHQLQMVYVVK